MVRLLDKGLSDKSELKFLLTWVYYLHFRNNTNIKETSTSNSLQTERIRGPSKCPTTIRCHLVWWFTWIPTITHNQVGLIFYCSICLHFLKNDNFFWFLQATTMCCEICLHVSIIFYYLYSRTKIFNGKIRQKTFPEIHFWIRIIHFLFIFACSSLTANRTYCDGCYK